MLFLLFTLKTINFLNSSSNYHNSQQMPPQRSSVFRSLLGLAGVLGGAAIIVYLNPTTRDYVINSAPQLQPYAKQLDNLVADYKTKISSFQFPQIPSFGNDNKYVS